MANIWNIFEMYVFSKMLFCIKRLKFQSQFLKNLEKHNYQTYINRKYKQSYKIIKKICLQCYVNSSHFEAKV